MSTVNTLANVPVEFVFTIGDITKTIGIKELSVVQLETLRNRVNNEAKSRWSKRLQEATSALTPDIRNTIIIEACKQEPDLSTDIQGIMVEDKFVAMALEFAGLDKKNWDELIKIPDNTKVIIDAWKHALAIKPEPIKVEGAIESPLELNPQESVP